MKKTAILIFTVLALQSCNKYVPEHDRSSSLEYFAKNFHSVILGDPVKNMIDLEADSKYSIFAEDFTVTINYNNGTIVIRKDLTADSTWVANGSYSGYQYTSFISMGKRNALGLNTWTGTGSGFYDEGNGFSARLSCDGISAFYWSKSAASSTMTLNCDSSFYIETFKENESKKSESIEIKKYSYTNYPVY